MQKEVYADNVDVNGEAHETVGENIRNGAKSPEAIAKALQSEDITFDMQALMNVLPFMDSSKKIEHGVITVVDGVLSCNLDSKKRQNSAWWYSKKVYAIILGIIERGNTLSSIDASVVSLYSAPNNLGTGLKLKGFVSEGDTLSIEVYLCVDR